jgi:hypothetical protein
MNVGDPITTARGMVFRIRDNGGMPFQVKGSVRAKTVFVTVDFVSIIQTTIAQVLRRVIYIV